MRYLAAGAMLAAWAAAPAAAAELPITKVTMFSSGVAYYQRDAAVEGEASAELKFKAEQINDILKSLVLQDLGGGTIAAVTYSSRDPVDKALRSFGVDLTGKPTLAQLLGQLRGAGVEVLMPPAGKKVTGTIVGVEKRTTVINETTIAQDVLNVLTDEGLQAIVLEPGQQVRLTDEQTDAELRKALTVLAGSYDAQKKSVVLNFTGQGRRPVRVAYMLEAPIWKTSYRLVLSDNEKPFLQGWAIVENTTDDDWNDIRLSLVSGRPISFVQDLYQPLYVPRPVVEPELYASLRPQTYAGATEAQKPGGEMDIAMGVVADNEEAPRVRFGDSRRGGTPARPAAEAARLRALGYAGGGAPAAAAAPELALAGAGVASLAMAEDVGELFEYKIQAPVTLPRQKSAMLPIVNDEVTAEKVSIYNHDVHAKFPLHGLLLTNSTDLHLMQGPVTVFDGQTYAGDARLDDLQPAERRLISYAMDLGCEGLMVTDAQPGETVSLRIAKGTLVVKHKYTDKRSFKFTNRDEKNRKMIVEQSMGSEWELIEPAEPFEKARDLYRFKLDVAGKSPGRLDVVFERYGEQRVLLRDVGLDHITVYVQSKVITKPVREALEKLGAMRQALDDTSRQRADREKQIAEITKEQDRIRNNMRTIPQSSDLYTRLIRKLDAQETELEKLQAQIAELREQEETQRKQIEEYLLSLDVG